MHNLVTGYEVYIARMNFKLAKYAFRLSRITKEDLKRMDTKNMEISLISLLHVIALLREELSQRPKNV